MTVHRRAAWYAIARSDEVKRGKLLSLRRFGEDIVLFRDGDGRVSALEDVCPHRHVRLRGGSVTDDGCVRCPYHGFEFDSQGACRHIPAAPDAPIPQTLRVATRPTAEQAGMVFLWHGNPGRAPGPLPPVPEVFSPGAGFTHRHWTERWNTPMERAIENQLDMAHLPFVHQGTIGGAQPKAFHAEVDDIREGDVVVGLRAGQQGRRPLHFYFPNVWVNALGDAVCVTAFFAPVDDGACDVYLSFGHRFVPRGLMASLVAWVGAKFSTRVTAQDRPIVEDHVENTGRREALVQLDLPIASYRRWREDIDAFESSNDVSEEAGVVVQLTSVRPEA